MSSDPPERPPSGHMRIPSDPTAPIDQAELRLRLAEMQAVRDSTPELEAAPELDDESVTARECPQCKGVSGPCGYCRDKGSVSVVRWQAWHDLRKFAREPPR